MELRKEQQLNAQLEYLEKAVHALNDLIGGMFPDIGNEENVSAVQGSSWYIGNQLKSLRVNAVLSDH